MIKKHRRAIAAGLVAAGVIAALPACHRLEQMAATLTDRRDAFARCHPRWRLWSCQGQRDGRGNLQGSAMLRTLGDADLHPLVRGDLDRVHRRFVEDVDELLDVA